MITESDFYTEIDTSGGLGSSFEKIRRNDCAVNSGPYGSGESTGENKQVRVVLKEGQTLRLLALQLYGNREFWVYIYLENRDNIHNPNRVTPGLELKIPEPTSYDIDPNNPQSASKAKAIGDKILEKWSY